MTGLSTVISQYTSQTLPFDSALRFDRLNTVYQPHTVAGAILLTANQAGAVDGSEALVQLIANGTNVPTFSEGFRNVSGVYDNRAGILNIIQIRRIGGIYWYSIFQEYVPLPVVTPGAPALTLSEGAGSNVITLVYDQTLDALSVPPISAFTLSSGTVSSVAVTGQEVRLTTAAALPLNATLTYTQPGTNRLQNSSGLLAPSFSSRVIEAGPVPLVFTTRAGSISVEASNNYTVASGAFATTFMLGDLKIPANTAGWVSFDYAAAAATHRNVVIGFDSLDTNKAHNGAPGYDRMFWINAVGAVVPGTDGAFLTALAATLSAGDTLRLRRAVDGSVTIERNNQGHLWEILYTWAGFYTGEIFVNANFGTNATQFIRPRIKGGIAK